MKNKVDEMVELVMDCLGDSRFDAAELVARLKESVERRAAETEKHPEDWTEDQRNFWSTQAEELRRTWSKPDNGRACPDCGGDVVLSHSTPGGREPETGYDEEPAQIFRCTRCSTMIPETELGGAS